MFYCLPIKMHGLWPLAVLGLCLCLASFVNLSDGQWVHCPTDCTCIARTVRCIRTHTKVLPQLPLDTQVL